MDHLVHGVTKSGTRLSDSHFTPLITEVPGASVRNPAHDKVIWKEAWKGDS